MLAAILAAAGLAAAAGRRAAAPLLCVRACVSPHSRTAAIGLI